MVENIQGGDYNTSQVALYNTQGGVSAIYLYNTQLSKMWAPMTRYNTHQSKNHE